MKNAKKAIILLLVSLLAFNVFLISASAYVEPATLLDVDINLEVGTYSGDVFTPLAPGTALHQNDIITVRIAPTSNFLCGTTRYPVMFTKAYFEVVGANNAAFTLNTENDFYQACSGLTGSASATGLPESAWPPALKSVGAGGNGTFTTNTAIAVNNNAGPSAPNGGYPLHMPGDWLFRFNLKVKQDITAGSGAKVWMSNEWLRKPSYPTAQMYFTKCLDSEQISGLGKSTIYNFNVDLSGANINLEPAAEVDITFDANGGTGGTGPTVMTPGAPLTAPAVAKEGYVLGGWLPELPATVPLVDTTYVAQWVRTFVVCTKTPGGMVVNIQGWTADSQYQIWSYQDVTSDLLLDDTSKQADQWILSMPYASGSSGDVQLDGSINFTVPNFVSSTANYIIAVRIADADDNFVKEIRDAYTPEDVSEVVITKVLVDGMVTTGYELKEIKLNAQTEIEIICNNVPGITYTAKVISGPTETLLTAEESLLYKYRWDLDGADPGVYIVELTATNGATTDVEVVTFELYSLSPGIEYASIDDMTVTYNAGVASITPTFADGTFSYRVREPGRPAQYRSVEYSDPGTFQYAITAPGVYNIGGYSTRAGLVGTEYSFDDGLIRTLVVPRTGGGGGGVTMTFTANQTLPDVDKGTPIVFTATATGLPGPVEYSFWRYDATGYVLVQDWSTDNTLSWTPARIGQYSLQARAKGVGAGSYEAAKQLEVNITDTVDEIADVTSIVVNSAYLNANAQAKKPIMIQANATATNGDDLLYKFTVYDSDMRAVELKDYSVDQYCVWTPREAGTYTITVMVKNQTSFGKYDMSSFFDVFCE